MPIPKPHGKNKSAYVSRCMGDPVMVKDYADQKQRAAVCYSTWAKHSKSHGKALTAELLAALRQATLAVTSADAGKIDRSAFIYLPPKPPDAQFAQCGTCMMFIPGANNCVVFSPADTVSAGMSCGMYLHGSPDSAQSCKSIMTPEQAGLVDAAVRCENCSWFDSGKCGLYDMLDAAHPECFSLGSEVDPMGCCNAWQQD